jgi:hypothetical protein
MKATYARVQAAHEETTARLTGNLQQISERHQAAETDLAALRARETTLLKQCEDLKLEHSHALDAQKSRLEADLVALRARETTLLKQCEDLKIEHRHGFGGRISRLEADLEEFLLGDEVRASEQVTAIQAQFGENQKLTERLRGEVATFAASQFSPDKDLEVAREEIAYLREKLADCEVMKRSMSSLLEGMGIHLQ